VAITLPDGSEMPCAFLDDVPLEETFWGEERGGLVFKAHRLLYHLTLGLRATKKKKKRNWKPEKRQEVETKNGRKWTLAFCCALL